MNYPIRKLAKKEFPPALLQIPQPPKVLYAQGELPDWKTNIFLSVVGSRKYSAYGRETCETLIDGLRGFSIVIVSGLAIGVDTLAHQSALRAGLTTLAIPGSGLDRKVLYPRCNHHLADKILEAGGCLLSEYDPLTTANTYTFPTRNRLMAGMAKAVLVIEAGAKSGTLITSRLATEYNRDVLAVPGSIFSPNSYGPNWLIRLGATPVTTSEDILDALGFDLGASLPSDKQEQLWADLSPEEKKVVDLLQIELLSKDELILRLGLKVSEVNSLLMIMEIKGLIKESGGEIILKR
ncbi:MAG: DNA-processing protein DprA [Patescibacteria group bacterium]